MTSEIDNTTLALPCDLCEEETHKTVGWIKSNDDFICDHCHSPNFLDTDAIRRKIWMLERPTTRRGPRGFE